MSVIGGQNVLIDCLAEGSPPPSVTWERGSSNNMDNNNPPSSPGSSPRYYSVISSGPHFEVYPNGSLLIKHSLEEDSGFYLCQASNSIGPGISKLLTLTVHGKEPLARFPPKIHSTFGSSLRESICLLKTKQILLCNIFHLRLHFLFFTISPTSILLKLFHFSTEFFLSLFSCFPCHLYPFP